MKKQNAAEECLHQILDPLENVRDGMSALHAILTAMQDISHRPEEFIPALRFACVCMEMDIDAAVKQVCRTITPDFEPEQHTPPERTECPWRGFRVWRYKLSYNATKNHTQPFLRCPAVRFCRNLLTDQQDGGIIAADPCTDPQTKPKPHPDPVRSWWGCFVSIPVNICQHMSTFSEHKNCICGGFFWGCVGYGVESPYSA